MLPAFTLILVGNGAVTICNLLRDVAIAGSFGATILTDRFFLAVSIPIYLLSAASGSYRSAVVPALVRIRESQRADLGPAAARLLSTAIAVTAIVALCGVCGAAAVLLLTGSSVVDEAGPTLVAVFLMVLPMYVLSGVVELSQGPLQAGGKYLLPNLARAALPVGLVLGAVSAVSVQNLAAVVAAGTGGALVGLGMVAVQLRAAGMRPGFSTAGGDPGVASKVSSNFRSLMLATSITYASPLVGQWLAGLLGPGAVSSLGYANRLTVGAIALLTGALAPVLLGYFSQQLVRREESIFSKKFMEATVLLAWLGVLMTVGFWVVSEYFVSVIYQRGQFSAQDAYEVALLGDCYALQFPLLLAATTATSLISASSQNRVFVRIGVVLFVVNALTAVLLMNVWAAIGIALASSLTYLVSAVLLFRFLHRQGIVTFMRADLVRLSLPIVALLVVGAVLFSGSTDATGGLGMPDYASGSIALAVLGFVGFVANRPALRQLWAAVR